MLKFEDIRDKALDQLQRDYTNLLKLTQDDPVNEPLAESLLKLRDLDEDARFSLYEMICGGKDSFLNDFKTLLKPNEHLKLLDALAGLMMSLQYHIMDDGYLALFRIEEVESLPVLDEKHSLVSYFLSTDDTASRLEVAIGFFRSHNGLSLGPNLVSAKFTHFSSVEEFKKLIDILGTQGNWDGFFIRSDVMDREFCFYEEHEMLHTPVAKSDQNDAPRCS